MAKGSCLDFHKLMTRRDHDCRLRNGSTPSWCLRGKRLSGERCARAERIPSHCQARVQVTEHAALGRNSEAWAVMPSLPLIGNSPAKVSPSASHRGKVDHKLNSQFTSLREEEEALQKERAAFGDKRGNNGQRPKDMAACQENVELRHAEFELQVIAASVDELEERCATEEEIQKEKRRYVMAVRTVRCLREPGLTTSVLQSAGSGKAPAASRRNSLASKATAGLAGIRSTFTLAGSTRTGADEVADRSPRTSEASFSFRSSTRSDADPDINHRAPGRSLRTSEHEASRSERKKKRISARTSVNVAADLESRLNQMTEPIEPLPKIATELSTEQTAVSAATASPAEREFNPAKRRGSFLLFLAQATQEHRQSFHGEAKAPQRRGSFMKLFGSSDAIPPEPAAPRTGRTRRGSFLTKTLGGLRAS